MAHGGKRKGAGRPPGTNGVVGGRPFMRAIADNPEFRELYRKAVEAELRAGKSDAFHRAFEAGYGRPPQALDVNVGGNDKPIRFMFPGESGIPGDLPTDVSGVPVADAAKHREG